MSVLQSVPMAHDLPPFWDGVPVEWSDWSNGRTTLAYHATAAELACDKCGAVDENQVTKGKRPPPEGATFEGRAFVKRTKSGRAYGITTKVDAWPVYDLAAFRCRHCGHDRVLDERTGETWDLDPDDYQDNGSWPTDTLF